MSYYTASTTSASLHAPPMQGIYGQPNPNAAAVPVAGHGHTSSAFPHREGSWYELSHTMAAPLPHDGSGNFTTAALNPAARPFVSTRAPTTPSPVDGAKSPMTPGKRMHNPYAAVAVPEMPQEEMLLQGQTSFEGVTSGSFHSYTPSMATVSPISPAILPANVWHPHSVAMPSPVAAPLPTSLPQRDGSMMFQSQSNPQLGRPHRGYANQAGPHQHQNHPGGQTPAFTAGQTVSLEEALAQQGNYVELARTANGSSFIQAAVREGSDLHNLPLVWAELFPALGDLLLDAHGCYVVKSVMERLPQEELSRAVAHIAADPQLVFSMCTHSLHTRRVVQYLLDSVDCGFIIDLLTTCVAEIATTQQGCIVMQRAMDVASGAARTALFNAIYSNLVRFAMDPFANYVVQHLLEVGDLPTNSLMFREPFLTHAIELSCNKFASNVMEKALFHLDEGLQHDILMAIYSSGEETLFRMLQDSFGNYLIQSSIALAPFNDVYFISDRLRPVLMRTPYGHKIEGRLERRLKGKSVGTRSPAIGSTFKANTAAQHHVNGGNGRRGNGHAVHHSQAIHSHQHSFGGSGSSFSGSDNGEHTAQAEEPW